MTPTPLTKDELSLRFTRHPLTGPRLAIYNALRGSALSFAELIVDQTPTCREQSLALTKLQEAFMYAAGATLARIPGPPPDGNTEPVYREGDIVVLKSGGPPMAVGSIEISDGGEVTYDCAWFHGDETQAHGRFPEETLEPTS